MRLLLCCLGELIEDSIVKVAVVVQLVILVNLLDSHAKLDDMVLVEDKVLDRL